MHHTECDWFSRYFESPNLRELKRHFTKAVSLFNQKPRSAIEYMVQNQIWPESPSPETIAHFLRVIPGLSKEMIGEFLGSVNELNQKTLHAYASTFDFSGMRIDEALRMFLHAFKLPKEAQQIDRVMEVCFSHVSYLFSCILFLKYHSFTILSFSLVFCYFTCYFNRIVVSCQKLQAFAQTLWRQECGSMANSDVAYLLSFSLIMLNTDRFNPNIKPERKMKIQVNFHYNTFIFIIYIMIFYFFFFFLSFFM